MADWAHDLPPRGTEDLLRRSKSVEQTSASQSLIRQMRGLTEGLPGPDRAFISAIQNRVRTGQLPSLSQPSRPVGPTTRDLFDRSHWNWSERMPLLASSPEVREEVRLSSDELVHAKATSLAALRIAELAQLDPSTLALAGLMHEVGRPYLRSLAGQLPKPPRRSVLEQLTDGLHGPMGAVLLEAWGLPFEVRLAVEHHHQPIQAIPKPAQALCRTIQAADLAAHLSIGASVNPGAKARELELHLRGLGIEPDLSIVEVIRDGLEAWPSVQEILAS